MNDGGVAGGGDAGNPELDEPAGIACLRNARAQLAY